MWTFLFVAFLPTSVTVDKVNLEGQGQCLAYASGYMQREALDRAIIRTAECIDLTTGQTIKLDRNGPVKQKKVLL